MLSYAPAGIFFSLLKYHMNMLFTRKVRLLVSLRKQFSSGRRAKWEIPHRHPKREKKKENFSVGGMQKSELNNHAKLCRIGG